MFKRAKMLPQLKGKSWIDIVNEHNEKRTRSLFKDEWVLSATSWFYKKALDVLKMYKRRNPDNVEYVGSMYFILDETRNRDVWHEFAIYFQRKYRHKSRPKGQIVKCEPRPTDMPDEYIRLDVDFWNEHQIYVEDMNYQQFNDFIDYKDEIQGRYFKSCSDDYIRNDAKKITKFVQDLLPVYRDILDERPVHKTRYERMCYL